MSVILFTLSMVRGVGPINLSVGVILSFDKIITGALPFGFISLYMKAGVRVLSVCFGIKTRPLTSILFVPPHDHSSSPLFRGRVVMATRTSPATVSRVIVSTQSRFRAFIVSFPVPGSAVLDIETEVYIILSTAPFSFSRARVSRASGLNTSSNVSCGVPAS